MCCGGNIVDLAASKHPTSARDFLDDHPDQQQMDFRASSAKTNLYQVRQHLTQPKNNHIVISSEVNKSQNHTPHQNVLAININTTTVAATTNRRNNSRNGSRSRNRSNTHIKRITSNRHAHDDGSISGTRPFTTRCPRRPIESRNARAGEKYKTPPPFLSPHLPSPFSLLHTTPLNPYTCLLYITDTSQSQ